MKSSNLFDDSLRSIDHFIRYPQMLPFIGERYNVEKNRILLVTESHYLPKESEVDISRWYDLNEKSLNDSEKENINSRNILSFHYTNHKVPFNPIEKAIIESGYKTKEESDLFKYLAWCNFFQRPEKNEGESIVVSKLDIEKSTEIFVSIVDIINPTIIIFLSSKAWHSSKDAREKLGSKEIIFKKIVHPNTPWWNRKMKKFRDRSGKEVFMDILKNSM